jgi:hypothetical protein
LPGRSTRRSNHLKYGDGCHAHVTDDSNLFELFVDTPSAKVGVVAEREVEVVARWSASAAKPKPKPLPGAKARRLRRP